MDRPQDPKQKRLHRTIYTVMAISIVLGIGAMLMSQASMLGGTITADELAKHIGQDPYHDIVVDVRDPASFHAGHIPYSMNFPVDQIGRRLGELEQARERQVVVVGNGSDDAQKAMAFLRQAGFLSVLYLPDGMSAWTAAGKPLDSTDDGPMHKIVQ
jgi:rhodanese-related sulfurtransferase